VAQCGHAEFPQVKSGRSGTVRIQVDSASGMHYIDKGSRDATHTVAAWLHATLRPPVTAVRWQWGFFNVEPADSSRQLFILGW
jgi:hypothetical protein